MTPSHSGGLTLFGVSDPENTAVDMAISGTTTTIFFELFAEDTIEYIFFAANDRYD